MTTLYTVLGGLLAAGAGAWLNERLRRARPQLIPTSMQRTIDVIPNGSVVAPNSDLLTTCSEHPFFETPPFEGIGKVDERNYIDYLTRTQELATQFLRVQLPAVAERAEQLQLRLAADDFEGVAHVWIDAQLLWNFAEGAYIREEFTLPPTPHGQRADRGASSLDEDGKPQDDASDPTVGCERGELSDGTLYVRYPGFVQVVQFPAKSRIGRSNDLSRELAERMATAFACKEKPDLSKVFNYLAGIEREVPRLEALSQRITEELTRLTRLSITALIANTGGTPVSISKQTCQVDLLLDGYTYNIDEDDGTKPRERRGIVELEMVLVDDDGAPIQPLAIEAGGVCPVRAVYRTPISQEQLPEGGTLEELLASALKGAERRWRLKLDAVLQRDASKPLISRKISFRDIHSFATETELSGSRRNAGIELIQLQQLLRGREAELSGARAELSQARAQLFDTRTQLDHVLNLYQALSSKPGAASSGHPSTAEDGALPDQDPAPGSAPTG